MRIFTRIVAGISVIILIVILVALLIFYMAGNAAKNELINYRPDLSKISDGEYHGSYSFLGDTKAEVRFRIADGQLVGIEMLKLAGTPGYGAVFAVETRIEKDKELDFDGVSGATITSNFARAAIKNAIENRSGD